MTKEEIRQAAQKEFAYQLEIGSKAPLEVREGFIKGAEWMQEKMRESNEGQALLYAVEKTTEKTKREMIEKAVKWMYNYFVIDHYGMTSAGFGLFELVFKQAMQDESK